MEISEDKNLEISTPTVDKLGRSYATGKRKNAVARVWIKTGTGKVSINGKDSDKYFQWVAQIFEENNVSEDKINNFVDFISLF